jgi:hypothetical protein
MRDTKARRMIRRSKRPVLVLTGRDVDLLILIGLSRYLSLTQAAREFYPSLDRARRRIRQLFDAGLIAVTLTSSTEPNLLSLTKLGQLAVMERVPADLGSRIHMAGPIRLAGVKHRLAITDTRIYAAHLGRKRGTPLSRWSTAGGELGRERGLDALHLAPDGMAECLTPAGARYIAVEVDCSTESLTVLKSKFERYRQVVRDHRIHGVWLVVIGGQERLANLEKLVAEAELTNWITVVPHELLLVRPIKELPLPDPEAREDQRLEARIRSRARRLI